jgi:hypothetical protein
MTLLGQLKPK